MDEIKNEEEFSFSDQTGDLSQEKSMEQALLTLQDLKEKDQNYENQNHKCDDMKSTQQMCFNQTLDIVKQDIRKYCFRLHEQIANILFMFENENQDLNLIILEFYKDIYFSKLMLNDEKQFSETLILLIWSIKFQDQIFKLLLNSH